MSVCIGTSGWYYPHWVGPLFPRAMPRIDWLSHYARRFRCVEINHSFYRLPRADSVRTWLQRTPRDFRFTLKASRFITHMKKLQDCREPLDTLLAFAKPFGERLAAVLFQLPPHWRVNLGRLDEFLALLPQRPACAIEFRDPSWFVDDVYRLLEGYGVGFCQFDLAGFASPTVVTDRLVYVRLHGPEVAYAGSYADADLRAWAARLGDWDAHGHDVFVFFDNDRDAAAVRDADRLARLVAA